MRESAKGKGNKRLIGRMERGRYNLAEMRSYVWGAR